MFRPGAPEMAKPPKDDADFLPPRPSWVGAALADLVAVVVGRVAARMERGAHAPMVPPRLRSVSRNPSNRFRKMKQ